MIQRRHLFDYVEATPELRQRYGRTFKGLRKEARLTQKELAARADVNSETISRIENGAIVRVETLLSVWDALGFEEARMGDPLDFTSDEIDILADLLVAEIQRLARETFVNKDGTDHAMRANKIMTLIGKLKRLQRTREE